MHSLLITSASASHPTCLVPPDFFPLVPDVCRKYCLEDKIGPVQAQRSDTSQALRETPENRYGGSRATLPCCANLLSDLKDNVLLCQQGK